ncbi:MAG: hypothetical protein KG029_12550, partial [Bacteroidetes bacterium]|nr:hypothetical protein [Bacteroidota bacterium]
KGFYTTLKNNTLRVDTLLKISEVLEVPLKDFFDSERFFSDNEDQQDEIESLQSEISTLKEFLDLNKSLVKHYQTEVFICKNHLRIVYEYLSGIETRMMVSITDKIRSNDPDIKVDKLLEQLRSNENYQFILDVKHIQHNIEFLIRDFLKPKTENNQE